MTTINAGVAITAGVEQTRVTTAEVPRSDSAQVIDRNSGVASRASIAAENADNIKNDRVIDKPQIDVPSDSVRISSSIGRGDIRGNLSQSQAIEIYETIAKLL